LPFSTRSAHVRQLWRIGCTPFSIGCSTGRGIRSSFVKLLILTGQRRQEIAGLRWSEIDERVIHLPPARTKNGLAHDVPLSARALALIADLRRLADADLVFTIKRRPVNGFSKAKERLDAASGVTDWTLHDLRRTVASGLQRLGVRLEVTEAVLNHKSGSTAGIVGVYQRHDYADEKRATHWRGGPITSTRWRAGRRPTSSRCGGGEEFGHKISTHKPLRRFLLWRGR